MKALFIGAYFIIQLALSGLDPEAFLVAALIFIAWAGIMVAWLEYRAEKERDVRRRSRSI